jgi:ubiquinone/menaquinone biosynthesis C-methylase UbiE
MLKLSLVLSLLASNLFGTPVEDRDWQNWEDRNICDWIHNYWLSSEEEVAHRTVLANLVKNTYQPGETFLEAGCGTGLIYERLVPSIMDDAAYVGIDVTNTMLELARTKFPSGIFLNDDLYGLSFADQSFDMVTAFEVLGHIRFIDQPIAEMFRVAKNRVLFTVWTAPITTVTEEKIGGATFVHTAFSHDDMVAIINNAIQEPYTLKVIALPGNKSAYIISRE